MTANEEVLRCEMFDRSGVRCKRAALWTVLIPPLVSDAPGGGMEVPTCDNRHLVQAIWLARERTDPDVAIEIRGVSRD